MNGPHAASTAASAPHLSRTHVTELDGVRGIAVLLVLLNHGFFGWRQPEGSLEHAPRIIYEIISHGWLGVDLFFVLSGFLITGILLDTKNQPNYFKNFYARRVLRIVPVYFLCLAVMSLFYRDHLPYFILSIPFLGNFSHAFGVAIPHGPGVFWSLCVEEHFYLLWPIVVLSFDRRLLTIAAASIVLITPVLRGAGVLAGMEIDAAVYQYSFFRFDGLATGSLIAIFVRSSLANAKTAVWVALAMVAGCIVVTILGLPFQILKKSVAGVALRYTQVNLLFGAMILIAYSWRGSSVTSILRSPALTFTGGLSYCIYLIHLAVGDAYVALTAPYAAAMLNVMGSFGVVLLRAVVMVVLSFVLAWLSMRFIEKPALDLKRHFD